MSVKRWSPGLNGTAFMGMLSIAQPPNNYELYVTADDYDALAARVQTQENVIGINVREYLKLEDRISTLVAALVKIASDGRVHVPNKSSAFNKADYRAGYVCGFEHQADIARAALATSETKGDANEGV